MSGQKKRALVTGSSRGIGRAIAVLLAKDGYEVIVHCAGNLKKAEETKAIIEKNGGVAGILQADLCEPDHVCRLAEEMGEVDVLVLNASLQIRRPWSEITLEECRKQLNCNFVASMMLIQAAVPYMKKQKWGRIVTIGSVQEAKPHPDMLVYSASKAAQTNMVHSLALQLAGDGITVNNVAPGVIYTDRNVEALSDPVYAKTVTESIPVGFYGTPEDCAGMVSLLCSEKGRYITGQSIYVDGGKSIQ
ncbi:MAG TPA: SDR family oxidoreductase [Candidatus Eisenbergiella merdipullorum]|uniref:SDR family oxidoreductase n=1 Tax=Candidatus Eisenbergiella merdipullorum TaxID=2838553 RepID=A0A9D2I7F2_9FIRM|nr:SDR family oxidoreductase [Candidatus Eisenbergiella merdipullorum]